MTSESASTIKTLDNGQVGRIFLPGSLFTRPNVGLFFSLYSTPVLFPLANGSREFDTIASPVIAATVTGGKAIANLSEPITILLQFDPKREVGCVCDWVSLFPKALDTPNTRLLWICGMCVCHHRQVICDVT